MGVPKFFRYISERYPCLSEFVKEHQIPEFDHLYLDMNGIIHQCSHPDDYDPHFRISEEKIIADIFHYIEVLFRMIKPQKLFFMAIDGVAPRAKMNQQRGRRFRSAKDAERLEEKAKEKGEALPEAARFDSNCITPGTVFMAKLHEQLKYFIVNKITNDKLWSGCKVILSGHETPGEGEHKIMDYIRYMRAQPGYNPNTRHCLYGLDADLIMLGLCTHEPHFSLLREEVQFGKKSTKKKTVPEQITFFLLHLSLLREYLELEFLPLKEGLPFEYDFEKIIDDWVLMGFLVGNDFIPNLPNLHIASGALPLLYSTYNKVLPTLDGYINEGGYLNLDRFQKYMQVLCEVDTNQFSEQYADLKYFESKTGRRPNDKDRTSYKLKKLETWQPTEAPINPDLAELIKATDDMFLEPSESNLFSMADDDQSDAGSVSYDTEEDLFTAEFKQHKKDYYMNKLDYQQVTPEVLRSQAEGYVRAIQWNLHYYYNSVCSWSWFYPHHYSPYISDINEFKDLKLDYDLGTPFKPYEQLLGVLPAASKTLLPDCYHNLMTEQESPIKDYYPVDFETDLNGKRQEWEAVVLIPFIDEKRLLDAMDPCNNKLSPEEVQRNTHGPMLEYVCSKETFGDYEAPEFFPVIKNHRAVCTPIDIKDIRVPIEKLIKGAYPGAKMDVYYLGFPTLRHLQYKSATLKAKVKVFDQPSRNENTIISILPPIDAPNLEELSRNLLGKTVLVGWPHLQEALVIAMSSNNFRYSKNSNGEISIEENRGNSSQNWNVERCGIIEHYRDRLGIDVGETKVLVQVRILTGRKYEFSPQGRVNLEKQFSTIPTSYPLQTVVTDISVHDEKYKVFKDIGDIFTVGSHCFNLGQPNYGCMGTVVQSTESLTKGRVKVSLETETEPDFSEVRNLENSLKVTYMPLYVAAPRIGISKHLLSRVTGTLLVVMGPQRSHGSLEEDVSKMNIGLNLKYNKRNEEIPGYTKKDRDWLYSQKAVDLVVDYLNRYPQLFEAISSSMGNDIYYEYELFPEDKGSGETVKEIVDWIKKQPFYSVERRMCGSIILEPDVVTKMEKILDVHERNVKNVFMQIKPQKLYKPDIQMGNIPPDPTTTYQLYDRVINVRESYTVPIGYTGTVIAIHKSHNTKPEDVLYDVLFDKEFAGGLALNCSNNRGYRMSRVALINKSHGVRDMEQKTGKPGELLQKLSATNNHYPNNSRQSNYQSPNNKNYQNSNSAFVSWNNQNPQYNAPPNQFYNKPPAQKPALQKSPQKAPPNFMPNFQSRNAQQQPNVQDQRHQQRHGKNNQNEDTAILKEILKIKPEAGGSSQKKQPNATVALSVQEMFAHASAQMQSTPKPSAPDASQGNYGVQLLSFYQMQGLGCPHYNYFNTPDGQCQAQLSLPFDKEPIFGMPAKSKELACENVAKATLEKLKARPVQQQSFPSSLPVKFPTPPRQWCESDNKPNNRSPQKYRNQGSGKNAQYEEKKARATRQPDPAPFIPLQAVRKQRENKTHTDNTHNTNNERADIASEHKQSERYEENASNSQKTNANSKPRRERKSRIAANFSMQPNKS